MPECEKRYCSACRAMYVAWLRASTRMETPFSTNEIAGRFRANER